MLFRGFTEDDFNVFAIKGLENRMEALKTKISPKLEAIGQHFAPSLSISTGQEMFPHVAKHARRTINPPKDTWVAFANNPRGYKMAPHFQIGLWETHVFIWFAVIYEYQDKEEFSKLLTITLDSIFTNTPADFVWSIDHTKPAVIPHASLSKVDLQTMFDRLGSVKKAEILCGIQIPREEAVALNADQIATKIEGAFQQLLPLFQLSQKQISYK